MTTVSDGPRPVLHLAWTEFQRRQVAMAPLLGLECVFLSRRDTRALPFKGLDYLRLFWQTMLLLRHRRPTVLWLQLPPVPLLWAAALHRKLFDPGMKIVADAHNAMFGRVWSRVPWRVSFLNRCDLVLVHNEVVHADALQQGVAAQRLFVLEDVPPQEAPPVRGQAARAQTLDRLAGMPRPWVLFPGSFGADEPVAELLATARQHPQWTFIITGRLSNADKHRHDLSAPPPNVLMPGYLAVDVFDDLLRSCDLVLALTRLDGIQLSVCNEALGFGKAMVASDTPLLRKLFSAAALMVDSNRPDAIAATIADALGRTAELEAASRRLALQRRHAWAQQLKRGPAWLGSRRPA